MQFVPCPEGLHQGIIVDITEPIKVTTGKFGPKEVFRIIFEIDQVAPSGKRFTVSSQQLTPSLHEKANLRKMVEKILGRSLVGDELTKGVDLDKLLLGKQVNLVVEHATNADQTKTYANVVLIQPVKQPFTPWKSDFIRFKERKGLEVPASEAVETEAEAKAKATAAYDELKKEFFPDDKKV